MTEPRFDSIRFDSRGRRAAAVCRRRTARVMNVTHASASSGLPRCCCLDRGRPMRERQWDSIRFDSSLQTALRLELLLLLPPLRTQSETTRPAIHCSRTHTQTTRLDRECERVQRSLQAAAAAGSNSTRILSASATAALQSLLQSRSCADEREILTACCVTSLFGECTGRCLE